MLLTFTSKIRRGIDDIFWPYTDDDFTRLVTPPKVLLAQPRPAGAITDQNRDPLHVIDSDITRANGKYHLFYSSKMNGPAGIYLASSDKLTEGFTITPRRIDPETVNNEGPTMFRRLGTDKYVLMYDVYGAGNMGFSETSDFVTFTNLGRLNARCHEGHQLQRAEARRCHVSHARGAESRGRALEGRHQSCREFSFPDSTFKPRSRPSGR
jgi:hypothetical protein